MINRRRKNGTTRTDKRLHRSRYKFEEIPGYYWVETAYTKRDGVEIKTDCYYQPGKDFHMYEKKIEDGGFIMYRSKQGLIDVEIKDIIDGYGEYDDFYKYEKFMSEKEKQKAFQSLDEEDKKIILGKEIKNILNGCGDYRDFHKIYKKYMSDENKNKCLKAFEKYY